MGTIELLASNNLQVLQHFWTMVQCTFCNDWWKGKYIYIINSNSQTFFLLSILLEPIILYLHVFEYIVLIPTFVYFVDVGWT